MFPKALAAGADIVTIDLEDAVAPNDKASAREQTLKWFLENQEFGGVEALVRVNCLRSVDGLADLRAIVESPRPPPALMLPKVKHPAEVRLHEELIEQAAAPIRLHVIIETNEGLDSCMEIARSSPLVDSLLFGGVDMAAELRVEPTWNALLHARSRVVHAAASAGVDVIDVPFLDLHDMDGLAHEARACAELGFTGKGAIHPKQVPVLNGVFSPSAEQLEYARRVVAEFDRADSGLVVIDGKLVEKPVLRSMHRILAIADRMECSERERTLDPRPGVANQVEPVD